MHTLIWLLQLALAGYFSVLTLITLVMVSMAIEGGWRRSRELRSNVAGALEASPLAPSVSIIVPAYNEEATIVSCVEAFLGLRYPRFEVIVVADGCKDETVGRMHQAFDLVAVPHDPDVPLPTKAIKAAYRSRVMPNLLVIDKENGGKSDAINVGMNFAVNELVAVVDADSLIEPDSLLRMVEPFAVDPDRVIAAGGSIRIANDALFEDGRPVNLGLPKKAIPRIQTIEYLRSFMLGRLPFARASASVIISGAFGLFRRDLVLDVGGYDTTTIGEDAELSVRLQRHCHEMKRPYHVAFVPDAVCWTEAPESRRVLGRQRSRWNHGLCEFLARHRKMVGNPRYGRVGIFSLPFYLLFEVFGPFAEIGAFMIAAAMWSLDLLDVRLFLLLSVGTVLLGQTQSVGALMVDGLWFKRIPRLESMLRLAVESVTEMVWYRPLTLWWRLLGIARWAKGQHTWGNMERVGIKAGAAADGAVRAALGERRRPLVLRGGLGQIALAHAELAAAGVAPTAWSASRPATRPERERGRTRADRGGVGDGGRRAGRAGPHSRPEPRMRPSHTPRATRGRPHEAMRGVPPICPASPDVLVAAPDVSCAGRRPGPMLSPRADRTYQGGRRKERVGAAERRVCAGSRPDNRRGAREPSGHSRPAARRGPPRE